jgi:hypothetical protein
MGSIRKELEEARKAGLELACDPKFSNLAEVSRGYQTTFPSVPSRVPRHATGQVDMVSIRKELDEARKAGPDDAGGPSSRNLSEVFQDDLGIKRRRQPCC